MKNLRPIKGKFLIERLIGEGENECQDFKFTISDARKIARSLSAFANHKGGRLLIGVKDNGVVAGVKSEEDIYMIETAASVYCRPEPKVTFKAYKATDEGAVVVVAEVEKADDAGEAVCVREADGSMRAYVRVADENIAAPELLVMSRRMRRTLPGIMLTADSAEMQLIRLIDENGPMRVVDLVRKARSSSRATTEAAARLLALGSLELRYADGEFRVCLSE